MINLKTRTSLPPFEQNKRIFIYSSKIFPKDYIYFYFLACISKKSNTFSQKNARIYYFCVLKCIQQKKLREEYMKYRYNHGSAFKAMREDTLADIEANFKLMKENGRNTVVICPAAFYNAL